MFAAVDSVLDSLRAAAILVEHLEFARDRLVAACADAGLLATDAAEALVRSGMPFRKAHRAVSRDVREGRLTIPWSARHRCGKRDLVGAPHPRRVAARSSAVRREAKALS